MSILPRFYTSLDPPLSYAVSDFCIVLSKPNGCLSISEHIYILADEPYEQKRQRDTVGVAIRVVLDQLWYKQKDPGCEGDAAKDAR